VVGPVLEPGVGFVVVDVGAAEVGAVDGQACGWVPLVLLHAPSASAAPIIPTASARTERRLGRADAYDPSPARARCV